MVSNEPIETIQFESLNYKKIGKIRENHLVKLSYDGWKGVHDTFKKWING